MSHFSVLVIGENPEDQLAPFQENNCGDCPKKYLEFFDKEPECRKEWETEGCERVVLEDGSLVPPWDERFRVYGTIGSGSGTHHVPDHYQKREVPYKELYPDFEKFVSDYHGYERDAETGKFGYWENPNKKWDWYSLGGRWTGFFRVKEFAECSIGEPGLMTPAPKTGTADQVRKRDVDIDSMRADKRSEAEQEWSKYERATLGLSPAPSWREVREKYSDADIDKARDEYSSYPWVQAIRKADLDPWGQDAKEYFGFDKEAFLKRAEARTLVPFAVVKDGKWYERGRMGWFGTVIGEKDAETWQSMVNQLFESLPDDTLLSLYDCHI